MIVQVTGLAIMTLAVQLMLTFPLPKFMTAILPATTLRLGQVLVQVVIQGQVQPLQLQ